MTAHRTRLGMPVRAGWLVREQVEVMPRDASMHLAAFSEPVEGVTTREFADGYGKLLADHLSGYEELDTREVRLFGGRDAVLRRYRHVPDEGSPLTQITAYLVEGGVGHTVTATASSNRFGTIEGDLLTLLSEIELDGSADVEREAVAVATAAHVAREPEWGDVRKAWERAKKPTRHGDDTLHDLSADELTALASLLGAGTFPFVDETDRADVVGDSRAAVLRAAIRSLMARGVVHVGPDGTVTIDDTVRAAIALALDPDLVVTLESDGATSRRVVLAADPAHTVEIHHRSNGVYGLITGTAADLVARVAELGEVRESKAPAGSTAATVPAIAIDRVRAFLKTGDREGAAKQMETQPEVFDALADASVFNRVRSVFRVGDVVHGGEMVWSQGDSQGIVEFVPLPDATGAPVSTVEARPRSADDLYDVVRSLLP